MRAVFHSYYIFFYVMLRSQRFHPSIFIHCYAALCQLYCIYRCDKMPNTHGMLMAPNTFYLEFETTWWGYYHSHMETENITISDCRKLLQIITPTYANKCSGCIVCLACVILAYVEHTHKGYKIVHFVKLTE